MNDMLETSTESLVQISEGLRADAKALQNTNRSEAMRLFRLYLKITKELNIRTLIQDYVLCGLAYKLN